VFENQVLAFEMVLLAFENQVLPFEKGILAFVLGSSCVYQSVDVTNGESHSFYLLTHFINYNVSRLVASLMNYN
jgi:hypothetical protein